MRPVRSASILRLDPAHQPLWRDEDTLQFGIDRRAEITLREPWHEPLLTELRRGIREESFDVVAHGLGAPRAPARALLAALDPVLHLAPLLPPPVHVQTQDSADASASLWLTEMLRDAGFPVSGAARPDTVSVCIVRGTAVSAHFAADLAADRVHLPVAFDAGGAVIGPLVVPGRTPCLACRDAQETDADPAWPRLQAQLIGRAGGAISSVRSAAAAPLVAQLLREPTPGSRYVRLSADGARAWHPVAFHEECRCRGLSSRSQRESAKAPDRRDRRSATTTPRACAQPA